MGLYHEINTYNLGTKCSNLLMMGIHYEQKITTEAIMLPVRRKSGRS